MKLPPIVRFCSIFLATTATFFLIFYRSRWSYLPVDAREEELVFSIGEVEESEGSPIELVSGEIGEIPPNPPSEAGKRVGGEIGEILSLDGGGREIGEIPLNLPLEGGKRVGGEIGEILSLDGGKRVRGNIFPSLNWSATSRFNLAGVRQDDIEDLAADDVGVVAEEKQEDGWHFYLGSFQLSLWEIEGVENLEIYDANLQLYSRAPLAFQNSTNRLPNPTSMVSPTETERLVSVNQTSETEEIQSPQILETPRELTPVESEADIDNSEIVFSLNDVIFLALENNRDIKNQYLDRLVQREELEVAEDKFSPDITPSATLEVSRDDNDFPIPNTGNLDLSTTVSLELPNGAEISLEWRGEGQLQDRDNGINSLAQNLQLSFEQPLLRGAGEEINKASIQIARLTEEVNVLQLKSTLIDTITRVIRAYRTLLQADQQLKIQIASLESAKQQLEDLEFLIEVGRRARVETVAIEEDVASRELDVLRARNNLERQRLALLEILDIDRNIKIAAEAIPEVESIPLDLETIQQLAISNKPEYLRAKINQELAELDLLLAEDDLRWQLDFRASYGNRISTEDDTGDFRAGLTLSQEFGDLKNRKLQLKRRQIELEKAENNIEEQVQNIDIDVANAVRDVEINFEEVKLAGRATELAERLLEIEEQKLRFGVAGSSANELVRVQQRVVDARNRELNARIDYLNALTDLWQTIGTTLDELEIEILE